MAEVFFVHPVHTDYCSNIQGQVRNVLTNTELKGTVTACGYVAVVIKKADTKKKTYLKHRFVIKCFNSKQLTRDAQVHHVSRNRQDNAIVNVRIMTPAQHGKEHRGGSKARVRRHSVGVVRISADGDRRIFASQTAAAAESGISSNAICICLSTKRYVSGGYRWERHDLPDKDIPNERWVCLENPGVQVSDHGRCRQFGKAASFGCLQENGYFMISLQHKKYPIHRLVCTAFHGSQPEGMTADHIDRNKGNNQAGNLRWATNQQQALNRRFCKRT